MKKLLLAITTVLAFLSLVGCAKAPLALLEKDGTLNNRAYVYLHRDYKSLEAEYDVLEMDIKNFTSRYKVDIKSVSSLKEVPNDGMLIELQNILKIHKGYSALLTIKSNKDNITYIEGKISQTKMFGYRKASLYLAQKIAKYLQKAYIKANASKSLSNK